MADGDFALDTLPSRTPDSPVRSALRADPYWDGSWVPRSAAVWVDRKTAEAQRGSRLAHVPPSFLIDTDRAWEAMGHDWHAKAKALAVLDAFRTASAEQLAACTGHPVLASRHGRALHNLFALGLIEHAQAVTPFRARADAAPRHLWRPAVTGRRMRARVQRELLTWTEWVLATGGRPWEPARQHARHDSLTLELALRAAEYLPEIIATGGEKFASIREVLYDSWGKRWPLTEAFGGLADLLLIRRDGLRILVEMSASNASEGERARRYARALSLGSTADQGTIVLFLTAAKPEHAERSTHAAKELRQAIAQATRLYPGQPGARTADRMFVADWSEWFPASHTATDAFLGLRAWRQPTDAERRAGNDQQDGMQWQPTDLLTAPYPVPEGALAGAGRLRALYQSPAWMRETAPPLQLAEQLGHAFYGGSIPARHYTPGGIARTSGTPRRLRT